MGGGLTALGLPVQAARGSRLAIGLQLYTVREAMASDPVGTLARVAEIGYREVEFAGYHGLTPVGVRQALAAAGLRAPAAHVGLPESLDAWKGVLDSAAEAGHRTVVIPWLPRERRASPDAWRGTAAHLSHLAEAARGRGLGFAYHNQSYDFATLEGVVPFDLLLEATDPDLVKIELDLFWIVRGGGDPLRYLARPPGRVTMVHVKDMAAGAERRMVDPGQGVIDFGGLLSAGARAGVRHAFVEHDEPADPFGSARVGWAYLRGLGY